MDKMTKALEQARLKRQGTVGEVNSVEPVVGVAAKQNTSKVIDKSTKSIRNFTPNSSFLENKRILNNGSNDEIIQPFKVLRTRLMHIMKDKGWTNIAVTSPNKDEGKSTVAINLAISIAASKKNNAALLDLDLWGPSVHT